VNVFIRKLKTLRKIGWRGVKQRIRSRYFQWWSDKEYIRWIWLYDTITEQKRQTIRREIEQFRLKPLISVLVPVYNTDEIFLRSCIESVLNQLYENWELCIADDCSPSAHVRKVLEEYALKDSRIKVVFREKNGHISAASNSALELVSGDFVALLDHDDTLTEHALYYVAKEINRFPEAAMIYSDEDKIDQRGRRHDPAFKPDWSPDFFYSVNYTTHLSVYRTATLRKIGGFRIGVEGSQDYDLALRVVEQIAEEHIRHIPHILYHWRAIPGSVALNADQKDYAHEAARRAIRSHFERSGINARVEAGYAHLHRAVYQIPQPLPLVSLIVAAQDKQDCLQLFEKANYSNYEFLPAGKNAVAQKLNAAAAAKGDVLVFIAGGLKPESDEWLGELISHALRSQIGAVGAKILYADDSIQHGGYVLGINGTVGTAHHYFNREHPGNIVRAAVINNFSAVSADCLAVRREIFESVGGFDAKNFPSKYYDVDFCLRLRERRLRIVWTPYAEMRWQTTNYQNRLSSDKEENYLKNRWKEVIAADPYYNPNLTRKSENFALQFPPSNNPAERLQ
jgi:O-antigen biosynthesis protein